MTKTITNKLTSVIIPTFNEEKVIGQCLKSLSNQTYKMLEIIIVDDGSKDSTVKIAKRFQVKVAKQKHQGPGTARNLGNKLAKGEILVFVDADMTFEKNFVKDLVEPILTGKTVGTFSKNEMVKNPKNIWSICWNINRNIPQGRMIPNNYPNESPVFRAILKKEFDQVKGFDTSGEYTDDWSLSKKLKVLAKVADGALYYHSNPSTLTEFWKQARWIGKNEFIAGTLSRKLRSLFFYSLPVSLLIGIYKSVVKGQLSFVLFKLVYDLAIYVSVIKSFFGEAKYKI